MKIIKNNINNIYVYIKSVIFLIIKFYYQNREADRLRESLRVYELAIAKYL